jgi:hypothetical protein
VTIGARGALAWRTYQAPDPNYDLATREDTRKGGATWIDLLLGTQWSVRGTVRLLRVDSNVPDLNATEWVFIGSVAWTGAVL